MNLCVSRIFFAVHLIAADDLQPSPERPGLKDTAGCVTYANVSTESRNDLSLKYQENRRG